MQKEVHQHCRFQMALATWRVTQDLTDWKQQLWLRSRQARSGCSWGLISLSFYFSKKSQFKKTKTKKTEVIFTLFSHTELLLAQEPCV